MPRKARAAAPTPAVAADPTGADDLHAVAARQRWLTFGITAVALYVARSFLAPVAWAAVLAVSMWPLYVRSLAASASAAGWRPRASSRAPPFS